MPNLRNAFSALLCDLSGLLKAYSKGAQFYLRDLISLNDRAFMFSNRKFVDSVRGGRFSVVHAGS